MANVKTQVAKIEGWATSHLILAAVIAFAAGLSIGLLVG